MKKLLFIASAALLVSCGGGKKEPDPKFRQQAEEMARQKMEELKAEDVSRFLNSTNRNENISLSIKDSVLVVKFISEKGKDYSDLCEFYSDLAYRSGVSVLATQLRDSITDELIMEVRP
jgi:hypothetical protein